MGEENLGTLFNEGVLKRLFPADRADQFFEALYGDKDEGAYDINLAFVYHDTNGNRLMFELQLRERPGKCLACNLTYGLPEVFSRHPLINIKGVAEQIETMLAGKARVESWSLGHTKTVHRNLHAIPLIVSLEN